MDYTLEDTAVPEKKAIRQAEPNPFLDAAKYLAAHRDKAKRVTVPVMEDGKVVKDPTPEQQSKAVAKVVRFWHEAGAAQDPPVSIRCQRHGMDITAWAIDRVKRPKKSSGKTAAK